MGRKKKATFEWVADGQEGEAPREGTREDRKALKARLGQADALVRRMAKLPKGLRARIPLDEEVLEALEHYVSINSGVASKRQLGFLRGLLRDVDLDVLDDELGRLG